MNHESYFILYSIISSYKVKSDSKCIVLSLILDIIALIWILKYELYCQLNFFFLVFPIIFNYDHLCFLLL